MKILKYLPYMLFAAGIVAAWEYKHSDDPAVHRMAPLLIVFSFGTAAILWGIQDLRSGRALVIHYHAARSERPFTYWAVVLLFRFAMGAVLLGALIWRLANGPGA